MKQYTHFIVDKFEGSIKGGVLLKIHFAIMNSKTNLLMEEFD